LGIRALRLRALVGLLLALERRRIAHPEGLGLRRFSKCDYSRVLRRVEWGSGSVCTAAAKKFSRCGYISEVRRAVDRADLNRRPDTTASRRNAGRVRRTLTDREIFDSAKIETGRP
jgi:hypothetical protein